MTGMSVQKGDNQSLSFDSYPGWWCYVSSLELFKEVKEQEQIARYKAFIRQMQSKLGMTNGRRNDEPSLKPSNFEYHSYDEPEAESRFLRNLRPIPGFEHPVYPPKDPSKKRPASIATKLRAPNRETKHTVFVVFSVSVPRIVLPSSRDVQPPHSLAQLSAANIGLSFLPSSHTFRSSEHTLSSYNSCPYRSDHVICKPVLI